MLLLIMWPASIVGLFVACLVMVRWGKDLEDDPEFQRRLAAHLDQVGRAVDADEKLPTAPALGLLFLTGVGIIVLFGLFEGLRPVIGTDVDGDPVRVTVTVIIEVVMGVIAALIFLTCKVKAADVPSSPRSPPAWSARSPSLESPGSRTPSSPRTTP